MNKPNRHNYRFSTPQNRPRPNNPSFTTPSPLEELKLELERTRREVQKNREQQNKAYESGDETLATACAKNITYLMSKERHIKTKICEIEKLRDQNANAERRLVAMRDKLVKIRTKARTLNAQVVAEVGDFKTKLHSALVQGNTASNFAKLGKTFMGSFKSSASKNIQLGKSPKKSAEYYIQQCDVWSDEYEQCILALDTISTTDFEGMKNLEGPVARLRAERKNLIQAIQFHEKRLPEFKEHLKSLGDLCDFLWPPPKAPASSGNPRNNSPTEGSGDSKTRR